jgi:hypothetical protein
VSVGCALECGDGSSRITRTEQSERKRILNEERRGSIALQLAEPRPGCDSVACRSKDVESLMLIPT